MRLFLTVVLNCWFATVGYTQPGSAGGSLRFRVYDPQGNALTANRPEYRYYASWPKQQNQRYNFVKELQWRPDDYLCYPSIPSIGGGIIPLGFTVTLVYNRDTMHIHGLTEFRWAGGERLDSIPFQKGSYYVDDEDLLNVRFHHARLMNYGWSFFKTPNQVDSSAGRITVQFLPDVKTRSQPITAAPDTQCDYFEVRHDANGDMLYAKANQFLKRKEALLISHLGEVQQLVCRHDTVVLRIGGAILRSTDGGSTWYSFHTARFAGQVDGSTVSASFGSYGGFRFGNKYLLATGYCSYNAGSLTFTQEGTFALHFDLHPTSAAYAHLYQEWQQQMRAGFHELTSPPVKQKSN